MHGYKTEGFQLFSGGYDFLYHRGLAICVTAYHDLRRCGGLVVLWGA